MFKKVLVANRGEIAVRVFRACREMGIKTVAVYSEADADAPHVKMADEAVLLGPAPSLQSYLVKEKIIKAAQDTGADAIHPGYGFLSEKSDFVRLCEKAGIKFIGPTSKAMDAMGDKVSAKRNAIKAGVPVAPASDGAVHAGDAKKVVEKIGLPVIVKAVHGGGGMGMRVVRSMDELDKAVRDASAQAASAFGSEEVFIEKFIEDPHHIEFQILGDEHGHVIYLGERECSIQRRNQKLLEEAPSPSITPEQRKEIGDRCVKLAKSVGYSCAGTMEFLYKDGQFYFMEMNTRLQVEHPVTELVTGVDLVKWQLRVASGEKLTIKQDDVKMRGHALELRINAEDAYNGFAPAPGLVTKLVRPAGPGVRVDDGIAEGFTIPSTYDSMVMKLITHAETRHDNLERMDRALNELVLEGQLKTNVPFHRMVLHNKAFVAGQLDTGFIAKQKIMEALEAEAKVAARARAERAAVLVAALTRAPGGGIRGVHHRQTAPKPLAGPEAATPAWAMRHRRI
ncbi:MAG: acetyl-CoA carboxylase, biotin carboxylase subunit [Thermoplasmata archaeon]|jgi:acetyl-CoA carboxylase biotin carboxylase subunit|nr:acetyl-CoA carboxylase, biotin carboxylase subunit [Thermoplasmata archaeon]